MINNPLFELTLDKASKTVTIKREFAAGLSLVWDAFTQPEILDQWWAPKPMKSETKYMDFRVGGRRFYAMVTPEGLKRWSVQEYTAINPKTHFKMYNTFADENENREVPGSDWDFNFSEAGDTTMVHISIYNESLARMERLLETGFGEGMSAILKNLDELLASQSHQP